MNIFDDAEKRMEEEAAKVLAERSRIREQQAETLKKFHSELSAYVEKNGFDVPVVAGSDSITMGNKAEGMLFTLEGQSEVRVKYLKESPSLTLDSGKFEAPKSIADAAEAAVRWLQRKKNA